MKTIYLLSFVATLLICSCVKPPVPTTNNTNPADTTINISSGLIAWYEFNGNAGDSSGNGNNGTVHGASLVADRFGHSNSAYEFNMTGDTADYIDVHNSSSLQPDSAISIAAWVLIDTTTNNFERMVSKQQFQSQNYSSYQLITGNAGVDSSGFPGLTVRTTNSYNWTGHSGSNYLNQWVYVTGTYDGANMKFYQNGVLVKTLPQTGTLVYDNEDLWIAKGFSGTGQNEYFKGKLDDIRIYSRALNQYEVAYLYTLADTTTTNSSTPPPPDTTSYIPSTWKYITYGFPDTTFFTEDTLHTYNLTKWDNASNSLWCQSDSSNPTSISQINIYFKDRPLVNRTYRVISEYWDGQPTNDSECYIIYKSIQPANADVWYSADSSQNINVTINNGKITASFLPYISVEQIIGNADYEAMVSGTLIEK